MTPPETQLFGSLPGGRFSPRAFAASLALHCIVLAIVICVPLILVPEVQYTIVEIKPPPFVLPRFAPRSPAQAKPPVIRVPMVFATPRVKAPLLAPKEELKIPEQHLAPKKTVEAEVQAREVRPPANPVRVPPPPPAVLAPEVKVGAFSGSAVAETPNRRPRELEVSGFQDRNDTPRQTSGRAEGALVGAFDAPSGTGLRSGSARKDREIASAGFAGNVAAGSGRPGSGESRGSVQKGAFGDVQTAVNAAQKRPEPVRPALLAAEIISKPKPAYTREARDLGLEGEVVLDVLFTASGDVRVLTVMRGLGHGLDEAAVRAAEQIRFRPAQRDGRPVDSRSVVQIIFRLT